MHYRYNIFPLLLAFLLSGTLAVPSHSQEIVFSQDGRSIIPSIQRTDGRATNIVLESAIASPNDVVVDPTGQKVYWSDGSSTSGYFLKRADLDGSNVETIYDSGNQSLSIDLVNDKIYWSFNTGFGASEIRRADLDGSNESIIVSSSGSIRGVAVDASGGKIYYTEGSTVKQANLDGSGSVTIADNTDGLSSPNGIRVAGGSLYVVDFNEGDLFKGNLDGSGFGPIYDGGGVGALGDNLDVTSNHVYLEGDGDLVRVDLNGQNLETVISGEAPRGIAADASNNALYWVNDQPPQIRTSALDGSAPQTVLEATTTNVRDVAVNPQDGMLYWTDSGDPDGFSTFDSVIRRSNPDGSGVESFFQFDVEDPRGIALDADNGKIYWADASADEVARANLDGTGFEAIATGLNRPVDVALDLVNGKIYWAEDGFSVAQIQRANLDGTNVEDIATGLSDALTVAVDPDGGKVYWVANDGSGESMRRANLDGTNPETIIASVSQFTRNLEVDPANGKLYWTVGTSTGTIQVSNLDGSNQQEFLNTGSNSQPRGLALVAPEAVASQAVSSSTGTSPLAFANTGVSIAFSNVSGSGTVTVTRYSTPPESSDGIPSNAIVSQYRVVINIDGASIGSGTQVRFDTNAFPGINALSDVEIYTRTTAVGGSFTPLTTTPDGTDLVVDVTGFSEFVFTSTNTDNPLPVELSGFTASTDDGAALLEWQTASEANNAGFYVERRTAQEGVWTNIGYELGAGTTAQPQSYRFRDAALPFEAESVDYRLRQVDLDGTATVLPSVTLNVRPPATLELHPTSPNPARSQVTVRYELPGSGAARIDVYNVLGQRIRSVDVSLDATGRQEITLPTTGLASGVYFVRLTQDGASRTQRFTVVR